MAKEFTSGEQAKLTEQRILSDAEALKAGDAEIVPTLEGDGLRVDMDWEKARDEMRYEKEPAYRLYSEWQNLLKDLREKMSSLHEIIPRKSLLEMSDSELAEHSSRVSEVLLQAALEIDVVYRNRCSAIGKYETEPRSLNSIRHRFETLAKTVSEGDFEKFRSTVVEVKDIMFGLGIGMSMVIEESEEN